MLHQCSGGCSCDVLHGAAYYSMLFPMSSMAAQPAEEAQHVSSPTASSVDCTLSLGTPSTRQSDAKVAAINGPSCVPSFCWDILSNTTKHASRGNTPAAAGGGRSLGGDPVLLARRCANCDTTSTPLWRNGPRGPKSLCNACGIRYKKEERRAAVSNASSQSSSCEKVVGYNSYQQPQQHPWSCYASATTPSRGPSISMSFSGGDDDDGYLSWRLNVVPSSQFQVTDNRAGIFHYQ